MEDEIISSIKHVSIFLSKKGSDLKKIIDSAVLLNYVNDTDNFKKRVFKVRDKELTFYCEQVSNPNGGVPKWLEFINAGLGIDEEIEFSSSYKRPSGLLLFQVDDRVVALTFGTRGRTWLKQKELESDFGIKVAMNMCDIDALRQAQGATHSNITLNTSRQISTPSSSADLDFNENEFLKSLAAHMKEDHKIILQGKESLTVKVGGRGNSLEWPKLIQQICDFIQAFGKKRYKKYFENYLSFQEVPSHVKKDLDEELVKLLLSTDIGSTHLALPEFKADNLYGIAYSGNSKDIYPYIDIDDYDKEKGLSKINKNNLTNSNRKIFLYSYEENRVLSQWYSLYSCLVAEVPFQGDLYVLSGGKWRKVDTDFVKHLNDFFSNNEIVESIDSAYCDMDIKHTTKKDKTQYREDVFINKYREKNSKAIVFDKSKIKIGDTGKKSYEFCDILELGEDSIHIIHIKKITSSLNYLFTQANAYCEAFLYDENFLAGIRKYIEESGHPLKYEFLAKIQSNINDINGKDYSVKLWILYNNQEDVPDLMTQPLMVKNDIKITYGRLKRICKFNSVAVSFIPTQMPKVINCKSSQ